MPMVLPPTLHWHRMATVPGPMHPLSYSSSFCVAAVAEAEFKEKHGE
jgi:hypothetical protein